MSYFKKYFLVIFGLVLVLSCDKEVYLQNPVITTEPFEPAIFDTVTTTLIGELEIDGKAVDIDSYTWRVFDQTSVEIPILSENKEVMEWIPQSEGVYTIEVLVSSGNKSVKETKQIQVKYNVSAIQNLLVGEWEGPSNASYYDNERLVNFTIESDGRYYAYVVGNKGGVGNNAALNNGDDERDHPDKKIIIENLNDNDGSATGYINFVHHSFGELLTFGIADLKFSDDFNELSFKSGRWLGEQQTIQFDLKRQ